MKKIVILSCLFAVLASNQAFAKTEGNYVSASAVYNHLNLSQEPGETIYSKNKSDKVGLGIGYKYAFNFDGIYIAPGVFAEDNNAKTAMKGANAPHLDIKNRYGLKADLGYDLTDDLAIYVTGGLALYNYKTDTAVGSVSSRSRSNLFYGVGITKNYSKTTSFSLEYNNENASFKAANTSKIKVDNNTIKLSLNYNF